MASRPPADLKTIASELARLIHAASSDVARIEELQKLLNQETIVPEEQIQPEPVKQSGEGDIGIWSLVVRNGTVIYERDVRKKSDWPLWANVHQLYLKGSKRRIVLLGESVARGYFYDPYYTVANELKGILDMSCGENKHELIDLARTSIYMQDLLELTRSCVALKPDAVVFFAGNNWGSELAKSLDYRDRKNIFSIFTQQSFSGVKTYLESRFREIVLSFLGQIKKVFSDKGIPVVFVIPAFNLRDWRSDDTERILLWLHPADMRAWQERRSAALEAKKRGDIAALIECARQMSCLDPSNPEGHELLGDGYLAKGMWEEARLSFQQGVDTVMMQRGSNSKPRCYDIVRKTILEHADEYGIKTVDADAICREWEQDNVPGRELFLDYCHHTIEGIKIVMRPTARLLVSILEKREISMKLIKPSAITPTQENIAMAHFCAAVHNANHGQGADVLNYHCQKAISFSDVVKEPMLKYCDFSTRVASSIFCKTFAESISQGQMRQFEGGLGFTHFPGRKLLNIALTDAIALALKNRGIDVAQHLDQLRKQEHGVGVHGTDLLESFYSATSYNRFVTLVSIEAPGYLQARYFESKFQFVVEGGQPIKFRIVYRTPASVPIDGAIAIFINDLLPAVRHLPASTKWESNAFIVDAAAIKDGVNRITVVWPFGCRLLGTMNALSGASLMSRVFPVVGEIYSFHAYNENCLTAPSNYP